jgi:YHS domain-containing protein
MKSVARVAAVAAVALAAAGFTFAQQSKPAAPAAPAAGKADDKKAEAVIPFFGNATCPMSGKPINKTKYVESDGQRAYYCCGNCQGKAKADAKAAVAAAYKDAKAANNKKCPVSGHDIDAKKAKEMTWQGQKVMLCCGDCVAAFNKDPMLYVTMAVYGAEDAKNKNCPVSKLDEKKDEAAGNDDLAVYKGKVVHFCCPDCGPSFVKDPDKYMKAMGN